MAVFIKCSQYLSAEGCWIHNMSHEKWVMKWVAWRASIFHCLKINFMSLTSIFQFSSANSPLRISKIIVMACGLPCMRSMCGISGPMIIIWPSIAVMWSTSVVLMVTRMMTFWCWFSNVSLFSKFFIIVNMNIIAGTIYSWLTCWSTFKKIDSIYQFILCHIPMINLWVKDIQTRP